MTTTEREQSYQDRLKFIRSLTVEKLVEMSNEEFDDVCDFEVRRMSDRTASDRRDRDRIQSLLSDPLVVDRWNIVLVGMKKSVEGQLGYKRADVQQAWAAWQAYPDGTTVMDYSSGEERPNEQVYLEKLEAFNKWRGGSLRFKNGVEERLLLIRKVRYAKTGSVTLLEAIRGHQAKILKDSDPDEITPADRELWKAAEV